MGLIISKLGNMLLNTFKDGPCRILMLGLDAAGKTTILYRLKLNETVTTIPTTGVNVEEVSPNRNVKFTILDVGTAVKYHYIWRHYFQGTEGLIFVVDSADSTRFEEAREALFDILESREMTRGVPVCVIANKQDLPGALSPSRLGDALSLNKLHGNPWHIQAAQATTGEGLYEAVDELARMIKKNKTKR
ncbi:ADP-ribosylation factor 6-like isoform X2 [Anneissia japonica]|uniref:ADP-ribosylation factor 6-like isoform X2 n=1 Tax=Anneissia japonica TaxID=1529436 RepID=UPI001425AE70|nr:ADP-ribosylation factor 6-like isoform X2 [Anneissia japonica]